MDFSNQSRAATVEQIYSVFKAEFVLPHRSPRGKKNNEIPSAEKLLQFLKGVFIKREMDV